MTTLFGTLAETLGWMADVVGTHLYKDDVPQAMRRRWNLLGAVWSLTDNADEQTTEVALNVAEGGEAGLVPAPDTAGTMLSCQEGATAEWSADIELGAAPAQTGEVKVSSGYGLWARNRDDDGDIQLIEHDDTGTPSDDRVFIGTNADSVHILPAIVLGDDTPPASGDIRIAGQFDAYRRGSDATDRRFMYGNATGTNIVFGDNGLSTFLSGTSITLLIGGANTVSVSSAEFSVNPNTLRLGALSGSAVPLFQNSGGSLEVSLAASETAAILIDGAEELIVSTDDVTIASVLSVGIGNDAPTISNLTDDLSLNVESGQQITLEVNAAAQVTLDGTTVAFSSPPELRSYTVAGLPSAAPLGQLAYVSNETGGAVIAFSDGTNWRRVTDRAIVS
jgi:hypothetical protein